MAHDPRVVLTFGHARVEVGASLANRRGGLRICAREAESKLELGLHPNTFSLVSSAGKVDSASSFQETFKTAQSGVCAIEVREQPEGKFMRAMSATLSVVHFCEV